MKGILYKPLYRMVSWLSDRSGGKPVLVRWKIALAAILLSASATTFVSCEPSCYDPYFPPEEEETMPEPDGDGETRNDFIPE